MLEIYAKEFKAFSREYYESAMLFWKEGQRVGNGKITVNGKQVDLSYTIKDGDHIIHETVREETPVIATSPEVLLDAKEYLIVNKPSSVPVHACGNFKLNTL